MSRPALAVPAEQALAFRAGRQRICGPRAAAGEAHAVVRDLVAVQAQIVSAAAGALAARVEGFGAADLRRALEEERTLVRGWSLRETAHVVAVEDGRLLAAAIASGRDGNGNARWFARRGLDPARWPDVREGILAALRGGPLTRVELARALARRVPDADRWFGSWGGALRPLAVAGLVAFGPGRGRETTFVRVDRWAERAEAGTSPLPDAPRRGSGAEPPKTKTVGRRPAAPARERAEEELVRRYLHAYGPAEPRDLAYWTGLGVGWAKAVFGRVEPDLAVVDIQGRKPCVLAADLDALLAARLEPPAVRLLPPFDGYVLAHRDKSLYLDPERRTQVFRPGAWVAPTVVAGGRVVGTWSPRRRGARVDVQVDLFERLGRPDRRALSAEVAGVEGRGRPPPSAS